MFYDQELTKSSKLGQRIKTLYHENITWQISGATRYRKKILANQI